MRIEQAYISPILKHFKKDFLSYWNLKEYSNPTKPAVFLGMYTVSDHDALINHKYFSLLIFGSMRDFSVNLSFLADRVIFTDAQVSAHPRLSSLKNAAILNIAIKDYSKYKVLPLGDKVYIYQGVKGNKDQYYNDGMTQALEKMGYDVISVSNVSNKYLREVVYPQTFCYVKSKVTGGNTTKWELGLMGRPTYHGSIPAERPDPDLVREETLKKLTIDDHWLDVRYWL